jgi:hypothetical protein
VNVLCLVGSIAILFYVLKYRVHLDLKVTLTSSRDSIHASRGKGRRAEAGCLTSPSPIATTRPVQPIAAVPESVVWGDIASALVNLGASKADARRAAMRACKEWPNSDFNSVFTAALQEVGRAA